MTSPPKGKDTLNVYIIVKRKTNSPTTDFVPYTLTRPEPHNDIPINAPINSSLNTHIWIKPFVQNPELEYVISIAENNLPYQASIESWDHNCDTAVYKMKKLVKKDMEDYMWHLNQKVKLEMEVRDRALESGSVVAEIKVLVEKMGSRFASTMRVDGAMPVVRERDEMMKGWGFVYNVCEVEMPQEEIE
ncbi:hypothetical protein P280DRAFT_210104 [Massarina eburnea CBS 473.64]|uniref:Uncharacterized protein n=1 Tax=Massarina eburnea CBS 473.64 TaxID=1395130 RepID=A0A6A6RJW1_9PLEO|nr:hypothetical protein P280DRAFT_210104 [Massarina eburnea CBS 473.64]